jgi:hypothetical protein
MHESGLKIEWSKQVTGKVGERKGSGPGNKFGWIRGLSWGDELDGAKFHDVVNRVDRTSIPLRPPAASRMTQGFVGWVLKAELNMTDTRSDGV